LLQDDPENERIPANSGSDQPGGITALTLDVAGNRLLTGGSDARINTWLLPVLNSVASSADPADIAAERLKIWWGVQLENPIGQAHDGRITAMCTGFEGRLISADSTGRLIHWPPPK